MKKCILSFVLIVIVLMAPGIAFKKAHSASSDTTSEGAATTPEIQQLESIQQAVETYIRSTHTSAQNLNVSVKALDRRLRLANCLKPLESTWSNRSGKLGRVTVQVSCSEPKPWRVHVQATVTMEGMVWTLARAVQRGDILSADILVTQKVTLGENNAAFSSLGTPVADLKPWLGFAFTQRVATGKVLNEQMLKPAKLLSKGDAVVIRHRSEGLVLQTRGIALSDASAQQQIKVRNSSSGKIIDVVAVSPGTVEILH